MKLTYKNKKRIDIILSIALLLSFSVVFMIDSINAAEHEVITFDDAYNASVAANIMRYGQYKVSYPNDIIFYNTITTGVSVLFPTSIIYSIWGISSLSTAIIPILYGVGCIWGIWLLLVLCFNKQSEEKKRYDYLYLFSAIVVFFLIISEFWYTLISRRLIGEIGCLFYLLLSFICLIMHYRCPQKKRYIILSGLFSMVAFLTKSSMIFFLVSTTGLIFIESIRKRIKLKEFGFYLLGMLFGFLILETYKCVQLGSFSGLIQWWSNEWANILNQSSGIDTSISFNIKYNYLDYIFVDNNKIFSFIIILLPVFLYIFDILDRKKKITLRMNGFVYYSPILVMGVSASSLLVYFFLFGGNGLMYGRRHAVNELLLRCFFVFVILFLYGQLWITYKQKGKSLLRRMGIFALLVSMLFMVFPIRAINNGLVEYRTRQESDTYDLCLMNSFLDEVNNLPENAELYCYGWWQEPNISLYLDKKQNDIRELSKEQEISEDSYFIIGQAMENKEKTDMEAEYGIKLRKISKTNIDKGKYNPGYSLNGLEFFSIYKIEKSIEENQ